MKCTQKFWVVTNIGLYYFNGTSFVKITDGKSYLNNSFFDIIEKAVFGFLPTKELSEFLQMNCKK